MVRLLFACLATLLPLALGAADRPHIVFFLADDLGYADIACYGATDAKTPHIDRLAAEGVKFTNAYAMGPECTPSRTAFLTGRYPQRVGGLECAIGTGNVGRYDDAIRLRETRDLGLPADLAVLAPALKSAGYHNGVFGKWHLGYEPKFSPLDQGFDSFIGFLGGNVEYFRHVELSDLEVYLSGRDPVKREGYLTDLITTDALAFLDERAAEPDQPFFLYVPHASPHFPFQGPDDDLGRLPTEAEWTVGTRDNYVEMLESLDDSVGQVIAALEKHGLTDNTIVVFASDHGAMKPGDNAPWRDFKGTLFDGGIRVPLVAKWPGAIEPGTVSNQVTSLMDLTASFLAAAGAKPTDDQPLDGIDILGHVAAGTPDTGRVLHWRSRRGERTWWATRSGDTKYIRRSDEGTIDEWLFDLASDPAEENNLIESGAPLHEALRLAIRELNARWEEDVAPER